MCIRDRKNPFLTWYEKSVHEGLLCGLPTTQIDGNRSKDRTCFFGTQCYIHSDDLWLVIYIGEKMMKQFEFGVINWYDLRGRTLDKSTRAYKSVQNIGWKNSGKVWKTRGVLLQKIVDHPTHLWIAHFEYSHDQSGNKIIRVHKQTGRWAVRPTYKLESENSRWGRLSVIEEIRRKCWVVTRERRKRRLIKLWKRNWNVTSSKEEK